ncbi:hypothetical protein GCM10010359_51420 [Streptomyces morookaense]|uniref:Uncharacterized protein n=1 Tax=Streptomyces morookaense TaxID=1970 RepID=A0A7Y7E8F4_STRMO|nr:hypothetical protein [Streptomyces morookaense]GHF42605.1 hypothetical protein GCM10010359_51420 [Streptomyces morookaense]
MRVSSTFSSYRASDSVRHLLVLPDRDAAEEAAEEAASRLGLDDDPQIVREALAGEDDAEDAQWLVVVEDPDGELDVSALRELAEEYDGWLEAE